MAKTHVVNTLSLFELVETAPIKALQHFAGLIEAQALGNGVQWQQAEQGLRKSLIEQIGLLDEPQRNAAEREALRILRLASGRGSQILHAVSQQLYDAELEGEFHRQDGGELGRSIWMRHYSATSLRLFDAAESILNAADLRGLKRLYDAFEVPVEKAPAFLWTAAMKQQLEARFTAAMHLHEGCSIVYVQMADACEGDAEASEHFLVVRFAGAQTIAWQMQNGCKENICYYPARDVTLVYAPARRQIEVCAHAYANRAELANVLWTHGFKRPLPPRPLNRFRYDLTPFAKPLKDRPLIEGGKVEQLYLVEITALLGNTSHETVLRIHNHDDLQEVAQAHWARHPFSHGQAIVGVTLVAHLLLAGDTTATALSIMLAGPNRCSLQGERDPKLRRCGMALLTALGVLRPLQSSTRLGDPQLLAQVARLLEQPHQVMDGRALAKLGVDIDRLADEAIIREGDRLDEIIVLAADGERFAVKLMLRADQDQVAYRDPLTGDDVLLPSRHMRKWHLDLDWLREEIMTALGRALQGVRANPLDTEPLLLGELTIEERPVAIYFASRLDHERQFAKVDEALRLRPRPVPGIVLTSTATPLPFAGSNVVIPLEDVLAEAAGGNLIDASRLALYYRHGKLAATGGSAVTLSVSVDGYAATLSIPGKAPWQLTGKAKVSVLRRMVEAYYSGTLHVKTKQLMAGTGCTSPANLFTGKNSPWRNYLVALVGARAWQLNINATGWPPGEPEQID